MEMKTCSRCGWQVPKVLPAERCSFCHAKFDLEPLGVAKYEHRYAKWLELYKGLEEYHTLTESEWLEVCAYFNGCAICGAPSIDARHLFVPFKDGGRYIAPNVVPICETCALRLKTDRNPFKISYYKHVCKQTKDAQDKRCVTYLKAKIEEAKRSLTPAP